MALSFTCPECGRRAEVPSRLAGRRAPCPHCAAVVRVPGSGRRLAVPLAVTLALAVAAGVGLFFYFRRPAAGPDAANPYVEPALPPGYQPKLKIPLPKVPPGDFRRILYPGRPSTFVLVKTDLWDLKAGQKLGAVEYRVGPAAVQALSPDGKHLALGDDGRVRVLALPAGQEVMQVPYDKGQGNLGFADFAAPDRLVVGKPDGVVEVRAVPSGKVLGSFKAGRFQPHEAALSPDGNRLAVFGTEGLRVHELPAGKPVFTWSAPAGKYKALLLAGGIRFSPDGKELAALCGLGGPAVLLCWDVRAGKLAGEYPVSPALGTPGAGGVGYKGPVVQWLPDGAGWLLNGHVLFHRPAGRIVWILRTRALRVNTVGLLDRDRLLAPVTEGEQDFLIDVPVPWPALETTVKALTAGAPAVLCPGQAVSVQVDVGALRLAEPGPVEAEIRRALVERFAADGIPVAEGRPTVVYARYQETAGRTLKVYEWSPPRPPGDAPPTTAEETKLALEIGIRANGGAEPLWRTYLSRGAGLIVSGKGTARDVHRDTLNRLKRDIAETPFPYFVPADEKAARLPRVSQL